MIAYAMQGQARLAVPSAIPIESFWHVVYS